MKGFDVLHVKSAVKNRNEFDLSRTHLTTMDFGQIVPLLAEETIPGDKFNIDANYFSRMAPLVKPTYGKFSFKTVAGFVPYHQLAWDADAWFAGKTTWEGQTPHGRFITMGTLHSFLISYCSSTVGATSANTDYTYVDTNGVVKYNVLTTKGKYWIKVLNALGYALPQGVDLQTGSDWNTSVKDTLLSAFPILGFFKLYNDYMSQSQRYNTSALSSLLQSIKYGKTVTGYNSSTGVLTYGCLRDMFNLLLLNYENDYFTSAWLSPNAPLANAENIGTASVPGQNGGEFVGQSIYDNYLANPNGYPGNNTFNLGQRSLDFLKSFDDWVRRNNYSGSRAVQQIYSRFGIKTDDYKSHYANVLATDVMPVQVGDITATAGAKSSSTGATTDVTIGDYAGKGIVSGSKNVSCSVSDYGIIIILGYFTVVPMNPYGYNRMVLRSTPLDYYNPEFDGIGADAISVGELYCDPTASASTAVDTSVFGFTERYNAYRYGRDQITGEFRKFKSDSDMNVWHTGRLLTDVRAAGSMLAQSSSMNTLPQYDSEYNRIFSITSGDVDHFYMTAQFAVKASRPMLNLNQVTNLGVGDTAVPRNGNVIS